MSNNMQNMQNMCTSSPYEHAPFRMNLPLSVCTIWQNMTKNMQNMNTPQKNTPKN